MSHQEWCVQSPYQSAATRWPLLVYEPLEFMDKLSQRKVIKPGDLIKQEWPPIFHVMAVVVERLVVSAGEILHPVRQPWPHAI